MYKLKADGTQTETQIVGRDSVGRPIRINSPGIGTGTTASPIAPALNRVLFWDSTTANGRGKLGDVNDSTG